MGLQVRKNMVKGLKDVIGTLAKLKPGADEKALAKELLKNFFALVEDVLIEVKYSLKLVQDAVRCLNLCDVNLCCCSSRCRFEYTASWQLQLAPLQPLQATSATANLARAHCPVLLGACYSAWA